MLIKIVITLAILSIPLILFGLLIYSAKKAAHAVFLPENNIAFVMAGNKLRRIITNTPGYFLNRLGKMVSIADNADEYEQCRPRGITRLLQEKVGLYWVSIFWPIIKLHTFEVPIERLIAGKKAGEAKTIRDRIESDKDMRVVNSLRFEFPRPFYYGEVEMQDRLPINLLLAGNFRVTDPRQAVFVQGKNFFPQLTATVGGFLNDFAIQRTYATGIDDKGQVIVRGFDREAKGPASEFSKIVTTPDATRTFETIVGAVPVALWIEEVELPQNSEVRAATEAYQLAKLKGDAKVLESERNLVAARNNAVASAAPVLALVDAYGGKEDPQARNRALQDRTTGNLGGVRGTLVMGNSPGINLAVGNNPTNTEEASPKNNKGKGPDKDPPAMDSPPQKPE